MNQNFPRRIVHACPPGHLLKRAIHQPRVVRQEVTGRDLPYLAAIRTLPCLRCGDEPSEAAHVRFSSAAFGKASGLGKKPSDNFAVSLCAGCHRLDRDAQHNRGEREFWDSIGINPLIVAEKLYARRGDLVAMRAVVLTAIAERGTR
jgi:hypothetical protein